MVKTILFTPLIGFVFLLSGCAFKQVPSQAPLIHDKPETQSRQPEPLKVAILLSNDSIAYRSVANMIMARSSHKYTVLILGNDNADKKLIKTISSADHDYVIALGLEAAKQAIKLSHKKIIFSQVFNFYDHDLVKPHVKAVSIFPSAEDLFTNWKKLSPALKQVAVITGTGFEDYIENAKKIAATSGVQLIHMVAMNDKQFLYMVKNRTLQVQGYWLLPDNRILSGRVLKEFLGFSSRSGKQVAVFSPDLLSYGGLLAVEPSKQGIARSIIKRIDEFKNNNLPGAAIHGAEENSIYINSLVASQLGLVIHESMKKFIYE